MSLIGSLNAGYSIRVSEEPEDPRWDAFVRDVAGGSYPQTSLWARTKTAVGYRSARVMVTQQETIVGGAQMWIRPLPVFGAIGLVSMAPLVASDDEGLSRLVIDGLHEVAKAHRVQYLAVQPPPGSVALGSQLRDWGFEWSPLELAPTATVLIDLTKDLNDLLAQMRSATRYDIRHGQRKGVTVREGRECDLPIFYRVLLATGKRMRFSSYPERYFLNMWRVFSSKGCAKLFLAEFEGEVVSALLIICFGTTVTYWRGGWSGQHRNVHPNEVMHWTAMQWAKSEGYRYYDFGGIGKTAARIALRGERLPDSMRKDVSFFKLGFGGRVAFSPEASGYMYSPLLRWTYNALCSRVVPGSPLYRVLNSLH